MSYRLYVDQFLLEQTLMHLILIQTAQRAGGKKGVPVRAAAGAVCCALLDCLAVLTGRTWIGFMEPFGVSFFIFRKKNRSLRQWAACVFWLSAGTVFLGGALRALISLLPFPVLAASLCMEGIWLWIVSKKEKIKRNRERYHTVTLFWQGRTICEKALVDTGNQLREPLTGKPAGILDPRAAGKLLGEEWERTKGCYLIPYRSIGKEHGWMKGVLADSMEIEIDQKLCTVKQPVFAISNLSFGGRAGYRIILNPEQLTDSEKETCKKAEKKEEAI